MKPVSSERIVACKSDLPRLWAALTDTERLNRAAGMTRVALTPLSDATSARYLATTNMGGFRVEYEERPFEWVVESSFRVLRKMRTGPVSDLLVEFVFEERADGSVVTVKLTMTPKIALLGPFLRVPVAQSLGRFERAIRAIDEALASGVEPPPPAGQTLAHEARLAQAAADLSASSPPEVVERLIAFVRTAHDADVGRIRPFSLADAWGVDRRTLLSLCLRSVRAGLLDLRWEIVCPSCRTATETIPALASLTEHGSCQLCDLSFELDLDESVEATFAPASAIREVDAGPYCIGGPARTPHVMTQAILPARGQVELAAPKEPGRYRLFVRGEDARALDVTEEAKSAVEASSDARDSAPIAVAPRGTVVVINTSDEERHAKIERMEWVREAATARHVTMLPEFRRDFSTDTLREGVALRVSRVGLFFSDLSGSTELYGRVGDAAAFKLVQDHFDAVVTVVERHGGTLVKTMGDAVMSVFSDDLAGVTASLEVLRELEKLRKARPNHEKTFIKLGYYAGSCYVVSANGILDYFGQTVNIAARLQGEARGGELVITKGLADRAIEAGALREEDVIDRYEAKLKGVAEPVGVVRILASRVAG